MPPVRQDLSRILLLAALSLPACSMRSLDRLSVASGPAPPPDAHSTDAAVVPPDAGDDLPAAELGPPAADAGDGLPGDRGAPARRVFLVVGSVTLSPADMALQRRLAERGLDVILMDDGDVASADVAGGALILISKTSRSATLGGRFRNTPQPVMLCDQNLYDDMGMVDGGMMGTQGVANVRTVRIEQEGSPLAAGLRGTLVVTSMMGDLGWGVPTTAGIVVASMPSQATQAAIFLYDTGARMAGLTAPARRAGFFLSETSASDLTAEGWALFDAAATWTMGAP
jgi:hypothetical protein